MTLTVGSLFSGIGGLDLGLERAGMQVIWQAESDPACRRVLARHWPAVPCYPDVRSVGFWPYTHVVAGGFPCQDLSQAARGRNVGLAGKRSGLWGEMVYVVEQVHPRFVVVENVGSAWKRWVPVVRRDLWALGYPSVPFRVYAKDVGAPFQGARVFVVATPDRYCESALRLYAKAPVMSNAAIFDRSDWGQPSSEALGVADGIPRRMERLRECGNAVVPAMAEWIGSMILDCA